MPAGRPIKTLESLEDQLPSDWQDQILELYSIGGSDVEIKAMLYKWLGTYSNNLWERWLKEEPKFWETVKMGRVLSQSWWTGAGRTNLENKDFSATLFYMNMKNRFGWADKQETKNEDTQKITMKWSEVKTYESNKETD